MGKRHESSAVGGVGMSALRACCCERVMKVSGSVESRRGCRNDIMWGRLDDSKSIRVHGTFRTTSIIPELCRDVLDNKPSQSFLGRLSLIIYFPADTSRNISDQP